MSQRAWLFYGKDEFQWLALQEANAMMILHELNRGRPSIDVPKAFRKGLSFGADVG